MDRAPGSFEKVESEGRLTIRFLGEFDMASEQRFDQVLTGVLSNGRAEVAFDLRPLEFIDSSGIRAIIRAKQRADLAGIQLHLYAPIHQEPKRTFELVGLEATIPWTEPPDEVESRLRGPL